MSRYRFAFVVAVLLFAASSSLAVTYIVPTDREMVLRSAGIVMAKAVASHPEMSRRGGVVTVTELEVLESLKGSFQRGESIHLVEPGGILGRSVTIIPGVPRYEAGKTYLVFLRRHDEQWGTWSLGLGQFVLDADLAGREYLSRTSDDAIFGWDEVDGKPHVEKPRSAREFLSFVRAVAKNEFTPMRSDYTVEPSQILVAPFPLFRPRVAATIVTNARVDYMMGTPTPCRWNNGATATFVYCCGSTPQPSYDAVAALNASVANWNGVGNLTHYAAGSRDDAATGGLPGAGSGAADGKHTVLFNDPNNHLAAFGSGVAGLGGVSNGSCCYNLTGDSTNFCTPIEVDVIMAKSSNLSLSQAYFTGILTHELGHTLGFRHSNQLSDNATSCTGSGLPCTTDAVMNATVPFNLATLRPWDQDAVNNVYGAGSVCSPPSNVVASANPTSVSSGGTTSLSVTHGGATATYQWFTGSPGSGTAIPGATLASLQRTVTATTSFYVAVTACSPPVTVNSNAVTVTVTQCTPVSSVNITSSATSVTVGTQVTLNASSTGGTAPVSISWLANGVSAGSGATLIQTPAVTTTYQANATASGCSSGVGSNTITVTVNPVGVCTTTLSSVTATPTSPFPGDTFTLTANATTTQASPTITYAWFRGALNDTSTPIGTGASIQLSQTATTTYWVRATSNCTANPTAQQQITVTLNIAGCPNANQLCVNNGRYRVTVTATDPTGRTGQGVALYQSNVFGYFTLPDFSSPDDPQIFVKVVGPIGGVPWVFYAGLTNLDYTFIVFDTLTGQTFNTYRVRPPSSLGLGVFQNVGDFDVAGQTSTQCANVTITKSQVAATPGTCASNSSSLCLLNRFTVTLLATDNPTRTTNSGPGTALAAPGTDKFGFFTVPALAGANDVQAFVKMLDASAIGAGQWVFLGGLTDFRLDMTVTDTQTGRRNLYTKPAGSTCGWNDTAAFPTP